MFHSELALRSTRSYFVARVGRDVVGYAGLMMTLDDGHVTTIAVDPKWHRHKIGTRLMVMLARTAIDRGAASLTLEVRVTNSGAQEMYRQFGFVPVGVRKNYYAEVNEHALVMWSYEVDQPEYVALARLDRAHHSWRNRDQLMRILGIETSATRPRRRWSRTVAIVLSSVVSSQVDLHARFGGVVPEIASRAHVELIGDVIAESLVEAGVEIGDLDAVARVTARVSPAHSSWG